MKRYFYRAAFCLIMTGILLLSSPSETRAGGVCPISEAIRKGDIAEMERLRESAAKSTCLTQGLKSKDLLHLAASFGTPEVAAYLIKSGFHVNEKAWMEMAPLHISAYHDGPLEVAKILIGSGADIEQLDGYTKTPLSWAAEMGHVGMVQLLLEHGANANAKNKFGKTPLTLAKENNRVEVIEVINRYQLRISK